MRKTLIIKVGACALLVSCAPLERNQDGRSGPSVSMVQLLATPEKFDRKSVTVRGFYHAEFESIALYLSRDDARFFTENLVSLGTVAKTARPEDISRVNDTYVVISGTFRLVPRRSLSNGEERWIMDITVLVPATARTVLREDKGLHDP